VREQLEVLLNLQKIDTELTGLAARTVGLPRRIAELRLEKDGLRAEVVELEERLAAVRAEMARHQRDADTLASKRSDLLARQLVIKTNEEYAALTHEIEYVKRQILDAEDAALRLMEESERLSKDLDAARADSAVATQEIERKIQAIEAELSAANDHVAIKRDERLRVSKRVDRTTLSRYERILASKGDIALAWVDDGACSGCHIRLPPQTVIEVKRGERFMSCESCGRILFWKGDRGIG